MYRRELLLLSAGLALGTMLPGCASAAPPASSPASLPPAEVTPNPGPTAASSALDAFSDALMAKLAPSPSNVVFSPWSIAMVLSMVREGALGVTADELDALLGASSPAFGDDLALRSRAMRGAGSRLSEANCLWGQRDLAWKTAFLTRLDAVYRAPLRQSDFRTDPDAVRREINAWVADQTRGKIPQLIDPGLVDASTRLVLVNALHFKAPWAEPLTEAGRLPFTTAAGATVEVPTLTGSELRPWWEHDGLAGTALSCEGRDFALVLVQRKDPATPVPVSAFGDVLDADEALVTVQLPAWKLKLHAELTPILTDLGVRTAFGANADFTGMTEQERLELSFVVHEAIIEVNAKGIEAAAATAAGMRVAGAAGEPKKLVLDRPFSYALMHVPSRTCLFLGQVADPTSEVAR
jgi:serpin B